MPHLLVPDSTQLVFSRIKIEMVSVEKHEITVLQEEDDSKPSNGGLTSSPEKDEIPGGDGSTPWFDEISFSTIEPLDDDPYKPLFGDTEFSQCNPEQKEGVLVTSCDPRLNDGEMMPRRSEVICSPVRVDPVLNADGLTSLQERVLLGLLKEDLDYLASGFTCRWVEGRGRTLISNRQFHPGDYVIEYKGEFTEYDEEEFTRKEANYASNDEACCVMHVLASDGHHYVIDATREFTYGRARLINHVRNPNLKPYQPMRVNNDVYRVGFYATELIEPGDELFWDYFSGEDPVQFIPMLQSDGTLRNFPKQLLWVYSIRTRDKQVIVQPSALSKWNQQPANQILNPSSRETETEHEKEINNNDTSVPNLASQSALSSQRKSKICTICFKVCKKLSTHIQAVHGITEPEEKRSILQQSTDLTTTVRSSTPELSLCRPQDNSTNTADNVLPSMKGRRMYPCPICGKVLKKLSTHLRLIHKLDAEKKMCVLRQVREVNFAREAALRHRGWKSVLARRDRGRPVC